MAATEANTEPVHVDAGETIAEDEPSNAEPSHMPTDEAQPTTEAPQTTDQSTDKVKPPSEKIWDSFLTKSGLGKVMGGKKKKEHSTVTEEVLAEDTDKDLATNDQGDEADSKDQSTSQPASEVVMDGQVNENVADNEEAIQEQQAPGAKPKQGEKSSVRDFIRKPVAKIFSHKSTEKKEGSGELSKDGKVRSKSLDRLEDADSSTAVVDQTEDPQSPGEAEKPTSQPTKPMKRWHSFKKLMAHKSQKKSTDESKDAEGTEGGSADAEGDTGTLDSTTKSEHTVQKRWKLKRSWTFQGLKRDPSMVGIHKPQDKDSSDNIKGDNNPEADLGATQVTEDAKVSGDGETQEKIPEDGHTEKDATAAAAATSTAHTKVADQHGNDMWTSFKKRVISKSKRAADAGVEEEEPTSEQEQTEEPQASKDSGKTAKSKRTHFNRAVSLKNFILRKGKSTSMDMGDGSAVPRENKVETKETDGSADTTVATELPEGGTEDQAATPSESNNGTQILDEHKSSDGKDKSLPSIPSGEQSDTPHLLPEEGDQTLPNVDLKANGENGYLGSAAEDTIAHNELAVKADAATDEEAIQEDTNSSDKTFGKDEKILNQGGNCGSENTVAESGEFEAAIDSTDKVTHGKRETIVGVGVDPSNELETGVGYNLDPDGGSFSESTKNNAEPDDQEETMKRMFYQAATSIVQTILLAATEQLVNEKDFLDRKLYKY